MTTIEKARWLAVHMDGVSLTTARDPRLKSAARRGSFPKLLTALGLLVLSAAALLLN